MALQHLLNISETAFIFTLTFSAIWRARAHSGPGIQNEYARTDPENSDGTCVVLRGNDGEWYLYDSATLQMKKHVTGITGGEEPEPRWDAANPKMFYYLCDTELRSYDVDADASTTIHDFKEDFPSAACMHARMLENRCKETTFSLFFI